MLKMNLTTIIYLGIRTIAQTDTLPNEHDPEWTHHPKWTDHPKWAHYRYWTRS